MTTAALLYHSLNTESDVLFFGTAIVAGFATGCALVTLFTSPKWTPLWVTLAVLATLVQWA